MFRSKLATSIASDLMVFNIIVENIHFLIYPIDLKKQKHKTQ